MQKENLNELSKGGILSNVEEIKENSMFLDRLIHKHANDIYNKLALYDLKLKQIKIIEDEIENVQNHPGNVMTNLGNNEAYKKRMERIVNESASVNSNFDLAYDTICSVLQLQKDFIDDVDTSYHSSKEVVQPPEDVVYYPNDPHNRNMLSAETAQGMGVNHISSQVYNFINKDKAPKRQGEYSNHYLKYVKNGVSIRHKRKRVNKLRQKAKKEEDNTVPKEPQTPEDSAPEDDLPTGSTVPPVKEHDNDNQGGENFDEKLAEEIPKKVQKAIKKQIISNDKVSEAFPDSNSRDKLTKIIAKPISENIISNVKKSKNIDESVVGSDLKSIKKMNKKMNRKLKKLIKGSEKKQSVVKNYMPSIVKSSVLDKDLKKDIKKLLRLR